MLVFAWASFLAAFAAGNAQMTLNLITNASDSGAVCLDGSPPGYYFRPGIGENATKFVTHFLGGGWCWSQEDCAARTQTFIGSSKYWTPNIADLPTPVSFDGIMSSNTQTNPDFGSWSLMFIMYCDGSSYTSDALEPMQVGETTLYFRGRRILNALFEDALKNLGMAAATDVIVTGSSAGGLTVYLHIDDIRALLPPTTRVVGMIDAGYFLDIPDFNGVRSYTLSAQAALPLWNATSEWSFNSDCFNAFSPSEQWMCFFAQYSFKFIRTPVFATNSMYDAWQLGNVLSLPCSGWSAGSPGNCNASEIAAVQGFRKEFTAAFAPVLGSSTAGFFLDTCVVHTETCATSWSGIQAAPSNVSMSQAFGNWYFHRSGAVSAMDSSNLTWTGDGNPSCLTSTGNWC